MRIPSNVFRLFILTLTLCMAGSSFADEIVDTTGNKKVPFGIRDYDIGLAHNFTLHDVDGEKFELEEAGEAGYSSISGRAGAAHVRKRCPRYRS